MSAIKYIIIAMILLIGVYAGGYYHGRYKTPAEIEVKEIQVEDTIWKDKYEKLRSKMARMPKQITETEKEQISVDDISDLVFCYNSSLEYSHYTKGNFLYVSITDGCKSADARFEIGSKNGWKVYMMIPAIALAGYGGYKAYQKLK